MKTVVCALRAGLLTLCLFAASAHAGVVVGGTRVVFPAQDNEVTVRLTNRGERPALVEAWIDDGDIQSTPDKANVPFLITPPLFRMEGNKDQSLRIIGTAAQLPRDRESLFWLNVLEVPPKPAGADAANANILQFAVRSRIKLFYRPANLPGDALKAPAQVTWKAVSDGQGYSLEVHNPSPFYLTFSKVEFTVGGTHYSAEPGMVAPMGSQRLVVKDLKQAPATGTSVAFDAINDFGASVGFSGAIAP